MKKIILLVCWIGLWVNSVRAINLHENSDGTVTDRDTSLTWQQDEGGDHNWAAAKVYCNGLSLAGGGWRLPEVQELESLILDDRHNPASDKAFFPKLKSSWYWSATPDSSDPSKVWQVDFGEGNVDSGFQRIMIFVQHDVRCVRAFTASTSNFKTVEPNSPQSDLALTHYRDNANGTVTDTRTNLVWQQTNDGKKRNWLDAKQYCQGLDLAGGGWRLPEIEELKGLVEKEKQRNLYLNQKAFVHKGDETAWYWSGTPDSQRLLNAWLVLFDFDLGQVLMRDQRDELYARCVRASSGQ